MDKYYDFEKEISPELDSAREYEKIEILKILANTKNNKHVIKEAIVPGMYFIFPILKNVRKNKLNFLIIICNRNYNFSSYSFFFSN